jgi:predicted negative regulator of RcsB-dependent stress response
MHLGEISIVGMELFESIARSNLGLGNAQLAAEQLGASAQTKTEHLGATHPLTLNAVMRRGDAFAAMGQPDEARALYQQALDGRSEVFGPEHSATKEAEARLTSL